MVFYLICHLAFACRSLPQSTDSPMYVPVGNQNPITLAHQIISMHGPFLVFTCPIIYFHS
ncbi:hypothetical protein POPTR_003G120551v4 [Populus trichocarpa]|uniref:Uncharacterized protein n=1 Tax=Populus trichocarpa TaxID=3694 RepID=A0ACC0T9S7_POPTR|nr:hypothetical protein POPTR_003G120551v4 [Populus trichocarpa]